MKIQEFLTGVQEELELESELTPDTQLKNLDEWDSMTAMLLIGYVSNEFKLNLTGADLEKITTVQSLIDRIGSEKFE